jgi:hypothetical protein
MNHPNPKTSNILAAALLIWGCSAMIGEVFKIRLLKGLGMASCAAPYTKVFCQATSLEESIPFETFAADFTLNYQDADGSEKTLPITPEFYQNLRGPYQRRNVYGAVLAYGPALPKNIQQATFSYALKSPGSIRDEFDIPADASDIKVTMTSKTRGSTHQWTFKEKPSTSDQ